jgi:hypothetical protein
MNLGGIKKILSYFRNHLAVYTKALKYSRNIGDRSPQGLRTTAIGQVQGIVTIMSNYQDGMAQFYYLLLKKEGVGMHTLKTEAQ